MSECMGNQDLKPTRLMCVLKLLESFIDEYFYLNPISQVSSLLSLREAAMSIKPAARWRWQ